MTDVLTVNGLNLFPKADLRGAMVFGGRVVEFKIESVD